MVMLNDGTMSFQLNTLALSVANRSACSFHLDSFECAISDIHLALALNYPQEKRAKVSITTLDHTLALS